MRAIPLTSIGLKLTVDLLQRSGALPGEVIGYLAVHLMKTLHEYIVLPYIQAVRALSEHG